MKYTFTICVGRVLIVIEYFIFENILLMDHERLLVKKYIFICFFQRHSYYEDRQR